MNKLIQKYNTTGPRYTSYPTVPYWDVATFRLSDYKLRLIQNMQSVSQGIALYIHLPYCESLCTFCGCHKRITKNHEGELPYIQALLKEWDMYTDMFKKRPLIKELHLGGGTPTFFAPRHLKQLVEGIFSRARKAADCEMSFEGHPNNTTKEHLQTLFDIGFKRVSFGIQDYDATVQKKINRVQSFHQVAKVTIWAKEIGYESISHDIIYGLPFQTLSGIKDTIEKTKSLNPDRLSFYGYAHVPWIKGNGQRGFKDEDIPKNEEKRALYETGRELLLKNGYIEVGMDHFTKPEDHLFTAMKNGNLHRNFMGYTTQRADVMIGLGVSSISDCGTGFAQNEKSVEGYISMIKQGILPVTKGHLLTDKDLVVRRIILDLMCRFTADIQPLYDITQNEEGFSESLRPFLDDGLVEQKGTVIRITPEGRMFVRNVCMLFDLYLKDSVQEKTLFSSTI